jgi:hypothetical protein
MGYYLGQDLRLNISTNVTLTGGQCFIYYITPAKTQGSWHASINAQDASVLYYNIPNSALTLGVWTFWAHVIFSDNTVGIGDPFTIDIKSPGSRS